MDILILAVYSALVWFVPLHQDEVAAEHRERRTVVIIPIVALATMILFLNVFAPSTNDVRVIKYVVNVVPQVRGRVIEVPVEANRLVKKGEVLFRIDPTPYELAVRSLEAQLAGSKASSRELDEQLLSAQGKVTEARSAIAQADAKGREVQVKLDLARACPPEPRARFHGRGRSLLARTGRERRQEPRGAARHRAWRAGAVSRR